MERTSGITPKIVTKGKQHDEHARRYVWYPLQNINFSGSQAVTPVWCRRLKKGRITLLESFEHMIPDTEEGEQMQGSLGGGLKEATMGTDAQMNFLMGNSDGVGYSTRGMTNLMSIIDIDPVTALEIETLLIPDEIPETLIMFKEHLNSIGKLPDTPVGELAKLALVEMKNGLERSISWCNSLTNDLEQELNLGRNGGVGIKSLSDSQKYYFTQVHRPLPEDTVGVNMGNQLSKVLAPLLQQAQGTSEGSNLQDSIEAKELATKLENAQATIKEQEQVIEALSSEENETKSDKTPE